jgi:hypothetical protein
MTGQILTRGDDGFFADTPQVSSPADVAMR